jgi:hypothetical protein
MSDPLHTQTDSNPLFSYLQQATGSKGSDPVEE